MTTQHHSNRVPATDNPLADAPSLGSLDSLMDRPNSENRPDQLYKHHQQLQPQSHRQSSSIESVTSMRSGRSWSFDTQSSMGDTTCSSTIAGSSSGDAFSNNANVAASGSNNANGSTYNSSGKTAAQGTKALAAACSKPLRRKRLSMNLMNFDISVAGPPATTPGGLTSPQEELEPSSLDELIANGDHETTSVAPKNSTHMAHRKNQSSTSSNLSSTSSSKPAVAAHVVSSPHTVRRTQSMRMKSPSMSGIAPPIANSHHASHSHQRSMVLPKRNQSTLSPSRRRTASLTTDTYFSELASRERRVGELRDELQRVQLELKRAEQDLQRFKQETCQVLTYSASAMYNNTASGAGTNAAGQHQQSIGTASQSERIRSSSFSPSRASRSLSHSQSHAQLYPRASSPPTGNEEKNVANGTDHSATSKPSLYANHGQTRQIPGTDEVFQIGRRAIWEFGSQVKGLFDDIRNVTIGEDPWQNRDQEMKARPMDNPPSSSSSSYHGQKSNLYPQQPQPQPQPQPQQRMSSASSNSYYML